MVIDLNATDADVDSPNNVFTYVIVGENQASSFFFINPTTGQITLSASVLNNNLNGFRIIVQAIDQGFPTLSSTMTVEVFIIRSTDTLVFNLPFYSAIISENRGMAQSVTTVTAQPGVRFTTVNSTFCIKQT